MLEEKTLDVNEVKTLEEQILEHSKRKEKIEQLKKELSVNSRTDIIEDEGEFYIVGMYERKYRIDVELRKKLPKSYFYSPECDDDIVGYNPFTGSIIYNLWKVGKTEMMVSEGNYADFHDTGYGISKVLYSDKEHGFGDKVPPTHILPPDFINYHQDLQGSIYCWGYFDGSLVNDIGVREHQRLDLINHIESSKKHFEEHGHKWAEEHQNSHHKEMERLEKKYQEFVEGDLSDLPF